MKEFFSYFFGQGTSEEFANFTLAHFLPILIMIGTILLIYRFRNEIKNSKHEGTIRMALAFAMIISEMSYYWRLVGMPELQPNAADHLPITVCGWVIVFGCFMVLSKSQTLFDICYFWAFSGSIFALITPTVITFTGPTRFRYYQFWFEHTLGYVAIFYMIFIFGMRPTVRSAIKSYVSLAVLAVIAYFANDMIGNGANYLFMARPESTPSILDILPPNFVLRLVIMALAVTVMFFVSYLPWLIMDKKKSKRLQEVK